jgi:bifunctional DNA-binding transcriptional regulator/antitoxin component of YhaV-PrlF toxin-antitoxin module
MSTALKSEITVPRSVRRRAGFKPGEPVLFRVADRTITIVPKRTPDEVETNAKSGTPKSAGSSGKAMRSS